MHNTTTGLPRHRENREFESPFSKQGKYREFANKYIKNMGKFWELKKKRTCKLSGWNCPLVVLSQDLGLNFWLFFCKLLRGLLRSIYSDLYGSLGKERMAMVMMEAIYKLKYFIVCRLKNTGKMARAHWKQREFGINLSMATLHVFKFLYVFGIHGNRPLWKCNFATWPPACYEMNPIPFKGNAAHDFYFASMCLIMLFNSDTHIQF